MASDFKSRARAVGKAIPRGKATYRVPLAVAGILVAFALIFDGLQFILTLFVIGSLFAWIVTVLAYGFFGLTFALMGINYFTGKRTAMIIATGFITLIIELVPFLEGLPGITIGVIAVIYASRKNDEDEAEKKAKKQAEEEKERAAFEHRQAVVANMLQKGNEAALKAQEAELARERAAEEEEEHEEARESRMSRPSVYRGADTLEQL